MQAFLVSTGIVALAEMGDKTQLLSLVLAARFRRPWPIIAGILIATLLNHALAAALGSWIDAYLGDSAMQWILGVSFLAMAGWMLIPDKPGEAPEDAGRYGVFVATVVAFFLAEMGDKTQVATIALAARYQTFLPVLAGTTLGMLLANAPVVLFGDRLVKRVPLPIVHRICALIFAMFAVLALLDAVIKFTF